MIEVGQKIYMTIQHENGIKEYTITKVGKKYFYIDKQSPNKIEIDGLRVFSEYSGWYSVYLSMEDYENEIESGEKMRKINERLVYGKRLPIDKIRKIYDMLFEEEK